MVKTKICSVCGIEKPVSAYRPHSGMSDGYLNQCRECVRSSARLYYKKKCSDVGFREKERERGREKYKRLKYKNKYKSNNSNIAKLLHRRVRSAFKIDLSNKELHHWNYLGYNLLCAFVLSRCAHKCVHKYLHKNKNGFLYTNNGVKITSQLKAYRAIKNILEENEFKEPVVFVDMNLKTILKNESDFSDKYWF